MEEKEKDKTIRIKLETWRRINIMRGLNDCNSFEDVIIFLLNGGKDENIL